MNSSTRERDASRRPRMTAKRRSAITPQKKWYLIFSGILVAIIALLGCLLYWINRPVSLTVDGEPVETRIGSTLEQVFESTRTEVEPGDFVSVTNEVLRQGEGRAFSASVDGRRLEPDEIDAFRAAGGESVSFLNGDDIMEDYDVKSEEVAPQLQFKGSGRSVEYISQWGYAGVVEHRTGKESGKTADVVTKEPVPCIINRTNPYLDGKTKLVALTFDAGPADPYTEEYLSICARYSVHATFFFLSENVTQYPELAKKVADAGHEVGHEVTFGKDASVEQAIIDSATTIERACGVYPTHVRPMYGDSSETSWLASKGAATALVRWSADSQDWRLPGADAIVENALTDLHSGSIILMNEGGGDRSQNLEALPKLIEQLQAEGYELVTISELLDAIGHVPSDVSSAKAGLPEGASWPTEIDPESL